MPRLIILALTTYVVFVLQSSFAPLIEIAGAKPNLVLAALVLLGGWLNGSRAVLLAALWGFCSDCLSEGRLGPDVIGFTAAAFAIQRAAAASRVASPLRVGIVTLCVALLEPTLSTSLPVVAEGLKPDVSGLALRAAGSACYTALLATVVSAAARWLTHRQETAAPGTPAVSNRWRMLTDA